jgi:hypothetical protein
MTLFESYLLRVAVVCNFFLPCPLSFDQEDSCLFLCFLLCRSRDLYLVAYVDRNYASVSLSFDQEDSCLFLCFLLCRSRDLYLVAYVDRNCAFASFLVKAVISVDYVAYVDRNYASASFSLPQSSVLLCFSLSAYAPYLR